MCNFFLYITKFMHKIFYTSQNLYVTKFIITKFTHEKVNSITLYVTKFIINPSTFIQWENKESHVSLYFYIFFQYDHNI
jgi:hypothetical protein